MPSTISIAVVDDHPIFREGVIRVLSAEPNFCVVGEGDSAEDAVKIAAAKQPDVILLDVSMPGGGLQAARAIATTAPLTNIMMLTVVEDDSFVAAALEAGVKGYVLKGVSGPDLVAMINKVREGTDNTLLLSPSIAARILAQDKSSAPAVQPLARYGLTEADRGILTLMSDGHSHEEIARQVGLDVSDVKQQLARILGFLRTVSPSNPENSDELSGAERETLH